MKNVQKSSWAREWIQMPTFEEYEREADEIDELVLAEERRARNREVKRKARERRKKNPLARLKCKCGRPAKAIINGKTLCALCLIELKGGEK